MHRSVIRAVFFVARIAGERIEMSKEIWDRLYSHIGNPYGVAGVMGNFQAESALISNNVEDSKESSLGMNDAQYTVAVDNGSYGNFVHDSAGYGQFQATFWSLSPILTLRFLA